ncbi:MAG: hypothetical protein GOV01_00160 [Candidatus Altiarchaeota archaeon]|nr:hypothetical protein [Candidatus Altiarchaeota archaeon]
MSDVEHNKENIEQYFAFFEERGMVDDWKSAGTKLQTQIAEHWNGFKVIAKLADAYLVETGESSEVNFNDYTSFETYSTKLANASKEFTGFWDGYADDGMPIVSMAAFVGSILGIIAGTAVTRDVWPFYVGFPSALFFGCAGTVIDSTIVEKRMPDYKEKYGDDYEVSSKLKREMGRRNVRKAFGELHGAIQHYHPETEWKPLSTRIKDRVYSAMEFLHGSPSQKYGYPAIEEGFDA